MKSRPIMRAQELRELWSLWWWPMTSPAVLAVVSAVTAGYVAWQMLRGAA